LLLVGAALFVAPGTFGDDWAWPLVPLGAQAVGGMLLTHGVGGAGALYEGAWERVLAPMSSYLCLALLHGVLLLRYGDRLDWDRTAVWLYVGFMATVLVAGVAGVRAALHARSPAAGAAWGRGGAAGCRPRSSSSTSCCWPTACRRWCCSRSSRAPPTTSSSGPCSPRPALTCSRRCTPTHCCSSPSGSLSRAGRRRG